MPKLPGISQRAAVRALQKAGFHIDRQSGHLIMRRGNRTVAVPRHREINALTMGEIIQQAGLTVEEFRRLL